MMPTWVSTSRRHTGSRLVISFSVLAIMAATALGEPAKSAVSPLADAQARPAVPGQAAPGQLRGTWTRHACASCALSLAADGQSVWSGSVSGGVARWSPEGDLLERWTREDGLSGDSVFGIATAGDGTVWATTGWRSTLATDPEGLSVYRPGEGWTEVPIPDWIGPLIFRPIAADSGGLWLPDLPSGLIRYSEGRWSRITSSDAPLPSDRVRDLAVAADGALWLATGAGLARRDPAGAWANMDWPTDVPARGASRLHIQPDGQIWLSLIDVQSSQTRLEGVLHFDGRRWIHHPAGSGMASGEIRSITSTGDGRIWMSHARGGPSADAQLSVWDGARWDVLDRSDGLTLSPSTQLVTAPDGRLWLSAFSSSMQRQDDDGWRVVQAAQGPHALATFDIEPFGDRQWFGHSLLESGAERYISLRNDSRWIDFSAGQGLPSVESSFSFGSADGAVDSRGRYWRALGGLTDPKMLLRFDGGVASVFGRDDGLPDEVVHDMATSADGSVWAVFESSLHRFDGQRWNEVDIDDLPSRRLFSVAPVVELLGPVDGTMIVVGGENFVARLVEDRWTVHRAGSETGLPAGLVVDSVSFFPGSTWIVTESGAVAELGADRWMAWTPDEVAGGEASADMFATSIELGPPGRAWVGWTGALPDQPAASWFDGLRWHPIRVADGLPDENILDIAKAPGCQMWLAGLTAVGVFRPDGGCASGSQIPTPVPSTPPGEACVCSVAHRVAPASRLNAALADPHAIAGFGQPRDSGKPVGPFNPRRECLSIRSPGQAYHPIYNGLAWKAGCP